MYLNSSIDLVAFFRFDSAGAQLWTKTLMDWLLHPYTLTCALDVTIGLPKHESCALELWEDIWDPREAFNAGTIFRVWQHEKLAIK